MYRNPKYLEKNFQSLLTDTKKNNRLRIKSIMNLTLNQLQKLSPREFLWYSSDDWMELQSRLTDFRIAQLNEMISPQKLKQIPVSRLMEIRDHFSTCEQELAQDGTMRIVRPLTNLGKLMWAEVEVNLMQTLSEAIQCSEKWHQQKSKNQLLATKRVMADEYHVFVDAIMARWKLDRKTVDKYFIVRRLLGYNVIALEDILQFSKQSLRAQAVFSSINNKPLQDSQHEDGFVRQTECLFFDRPENQDQGVETIGNDLVETLYDLQEIMDEIRQDDQLFQICASLPYFDPNMDKRTFERHVRNGFWEHYRIGKQFRISKRQVLESALYALRVREQTVTS